MIMGTEINLIIKSLESLVLIFWIFKTKVARIGVYTSETD